MAEQRIAHTFPCSVDDFWKVFFSEEYSKELFLGRLRFESFEILSFEETDKEIRRKLHAVPRVGDLPGPLKKVAKDGVGYTEHGVFDKATKRFKITVVPSSMPDRMNITGESYCEPRGEKSCERIYLAVVEARIFGVGGILEARIIGDLVKSYDKSAEFTRNWILERGV